MTLEQRIEHLENNLKGQDTAQRAEQLAEINLNDVVRKMGLDPDKVSAIAKEKKQSRAVVIAAELGIPYIDFVRELKLGAQGK